MLSWTVTTAPRLLPVTKSRICHQWLLRAPSLRRQFTGTPLTLSTGSKTTPEHFHNFFDRKPLTFLTPNPPEQNPKAPAENTAPTTTNIPPLPRRRKRELEPAPDASSLLTNSSRAATSPLKREALAYLALSKPRLTALIVLTTMTSYALFPTNPLLAVGTPTLSTLTLLYLTVGTTLSSASANALNMIFEPEYDRQMSRTRNRPLVRGLLNKPQAYAFAATTGTLGVAALHLGVNPTVAALGALNIFLYAGVYTPMKRVHIANTWVGAVVGGIPPLMGWAAAAGSTALHGNPTELLQHPGGWLLASLLFAWQFPHFNALSWTIREEYKMAGYQMMAWKNPALNARVALRYSLLFFPICIGLCMVGVTDWGFAVDSSVANAWLVKEAYGFWKNGGEGGRARGLFWASVWHLPIVMVLAMVHKEGLWKGVWEWISGVRATEEERIA